MCVHNIGIMARKGHHAEVRSCLASYALLHDPSGLLHEPLRRGWSEDRVMVRVMVGVRVIVRVRVRVGVRDRDRFGVRVGVLVRVKFRIGVRVRVRVRVWVRVLPKSCLRTGSMPQELSDTARS